MPAGGKVPRSRLDLRRSPQPLQAEARGQGQRRNGVTGAAEESRYHKTDHPRHSYLGRVCSFNSFGGEGGRLQPGRQLRGVDPGKHSTPTPKLSTAQVMLMDGRLSSHLVLRSSSHTDG
jgi:hypothetical protein